MPHRFYRCSLWGLFLLMLLTGCAHRNVNDAADAGAPPPTGGGAVAAAPEAAGSSDRADAIEPSEAAQSAEPAGPTESVEAAEETGAVDDAFSDDEFFDEFEAEYQQTPLLVADPLEPLNRVLFQFNDKFYFFLFKPVTQTYSALVPQILRIGIRNFFDNIRTPIRLVNCILQGKAAAADIEMARFLANSTIGILGFGDPAAKYYGLSMSEEDLGQTLGAWGIGNGVYLVLPFLGSTTLRDGLGDIGDIYLNPLNYLVDSTAAGIGIYAYRQVNETSFRIGEYEAIKEAAIDPYQAVRDGYIQFRNAKVAE